MQKRKNLRLLIIFLLLLCWTLIFINLRESGKRISVDEYMFAVQDTTSIEKIIMHKSSEEEIILEENTDKWRVNGQYILDPSMKTVLMAVLNQVRVKRSVPKNKIESIDEDLDQQGNLIDIMMNDGTTKTFITGGNGISISYFKYPVEDPYIVYLPGYESYVSGIFEVTVNDWRDRLIFQTSWLGLKELSIIYPDRPEDNVVIKPENNLYSIENVSDLDTVALMNYIDEISYFYTDQYISRGQIPAYDSLMQTTPAVLFSVDAIGIENTVQIRFYALLPGERIRLGVIDEKDMCLFADQRISYVFKKRNDFVR
jgi:hypothetical protein